MSKRAILLKALRSTPADLAAMLKRIGEEDARRRPTPDQWSLSDVMNHLIYVEGKYLARLKRVVDEECPHVPVIEPDESVHVLQIPPRQLLAHFEQARSATLEFLENLSMGQWQRPAVHPDLGQTTLRYLVQYLVDHDTEHLSQMAVLRKTKR